MKWFRKHLKHGSRLALMALLIQFVATFGHFHPIEARAAGLPAGVFLAAPPAADALPQDLIVVSSTTTADAAQQRTHPHHGSDPNDICSICAMMALASTALFGTPPVLLLPQAAELLYLTTDAAFAHLHPASTAFQPRAPPAS
jgi:hypothetical protein